MFDVRIEFPFDDDFANNDDRLFNAVGYTSHWGGAGFGLRDHGYRVRDFAEARRIKLAADGLFGDDSATIRETTTH